MDSSIEKWKRWAPMGALMVCGGLISCTPVSRSPVVARHGVVRDGLGSSSSLPDSSSESKWTFVDLSATQTESNGYDRQTTSSGDHLLIRLKGAGGVGMAMMEIDHYLSNARFVEGVFTLQELDVTGAVIAEHVLWQGDHPGGVFKRTYQRMVPVTKGVHACVIVTRAKWYDQTEITGGRSYFTYQRVGNELLSLQGDAWMFEGYRIGRLMKAKGLNNKDIESVRLADPKLAYDYERRENRLPPDPDGQPKRRASTPVKAMVDQNVRYERSSVPSSPVYTSSEPMPITVFSDNPVVISSVVGAYPTSLPASIERKTVFVYLTIDRDGRVTKTRALTDDRNLGAAAEDAAKQWVFKPGKVQGVAIGGSITIPVVFEPQP